MSRRIDIELTSTRDDGSWTWRAAGAREPRGTLESAILPEGAAVGQVLRAEIEGHLDGLSVVAVLPPKAPRSEPDRLELKSATSSDQPLVTSTLAPRRSGERGRRNDRGRDRDREGGSGRRERRSDRGRDRQEGRHERSARPAPPPVEEKPKPKRLRPGRVHRAALLESVPAEQRPIAEQLLAGGIPAVRHAIDKQNEELKAAGKTEVKPDALLRVAEDLRGKASAAAWRDRAEAAAAIVDELDLRDLRSVVNAAGDAGRDDEAKALASQLREALANRVEKEHSAWLAELAETVKAGRVVRALRLSSRPPKAGAPIPGDVATQLAEATAASLTSETGSDRWATVLDALAYSPVRRRVIPQSLPEKLSPDLRSTIARLATRLPEIAHIFDIEADPAAERAARTGNRRGGGRKADDRGKGGKGRGERGRGAKGGRPRDGGGGGDKSSEAKSGAKAPEAKSGAKAPEAKTGAKAPEAKTGAKAPEGEAPEAAEPEAQAPEVTEAESLEAAEPESAAPHTTQAESAEPESAAPEATQAEAPEVAEVGSPAPETNDSPDEGAEAKDETPHPATEANGASSGDATAPAEAGDAPTDAVRQ